MDSKHKRFRAKTTITARLDKTYSTTPAPTVTVDCPEWEYEAETMREAAEVALTDSLRVNGFAPVGDPTFLSTDTTVSVQVMGAWNNRKGKMVVHLRAPSWGDEV